MFLITWGMQRALRYEPSAQVHLKGFQLASWGGEGAVFTIREELNRVFKRLKAKTAIRKFGEECECVSNAKSSRVL